MEDLTGIGKALSAVADLTKELREFVYKLVGPAGEEIGLLLQDKVKYRRFKNFLRALEGAQQILREKGIQPKAVGLEILVPLIEGSSLTEDDDLVSKWAGLLASASAGDSPHVSFPRILAEITPGEARLLDRLLTWQEAWTIAGAWNQTEHTMGKLRMAIGFSKEEFPIAVENLIRLQLVRIDVFWDAEAVYDREDEVHIHLLPLGISFVGACRGPGHRPQAAAQPGPGQRVPRG